MAAERARETGRSDRLFEDLLAESLAGREGVDLMARMQVDLPQNPTLAIRTRFFDDALTRILVDHRIGQAVALAGMDTRTYRLDLPTTFEIDLPARLAVKDARLAQASAGPRCRRVTVAADLTGEWADNLVEAGFRSEAPAVFWAEGLLGYLEESEVHRLLDVLDRVAAPGSFLLTDVAGQSTLDAPDVAFWRGRLAANGITGGRFGTDDPEDLLAAHGWHARVTQYGDEGASFGRWPYPAIPRDDLGSPHNYLIVGNR